MSATYNRLIRLPEVLYLTGLSRSALYRLEAGGKSLGRVKIGARAAAWRLDKVQEWVDNRKTRRTNYWSSSAMNGWTPQRSKRQSGLISKSTGPRTPVGKAVSSRNAYKGGTQPILRTLAKILRQQREA